MSCHFSQKKKFLHLSLRDGKRNSPCIQTFFTGITSFLASSFLICRSKPMISCWLPFISEHLLPMSLTNAMRYWSEFPHSLFLLHSSTKMLLRFPVILLGFPRNRPFSYEVEQPRRITSTKRSSSYFWWSSVLEGWRWVRRTGCYEAKASLWNVK